MRVEGRWWRSEVPGGNARKTKLTRSIKLRFRAPPSFSTVVLVIEFEDVISLPSRPCKSRIDNEDSHRSRLYVEPITEVRSSRDIPTNFYTYMTKSFF